jgi:hypothetical protein
MAHSQKFLQIVFLNLFSEFFLRCNRIFSIYREDDMEVLDLDPVHYPSNGLSPSVEYLKTIRKDVMHFDVSLQSLFADAIYKSTWTAHVHFSRCESVVQGSVPLVAAHTQYIAASCGGPTRSVLCLPE